MFELRIVGFGEFVKANTVKPNKTVLGTQPEKAVTGLEDGIDGGLNKPLILAPNSMHVLSERATGIEGKRARNSDADDE